MPDPYDPKVTPRTFTDRWPADSRRGQAAAGDDPLAELAKIVQGRPSAVAAPAKAPPRSASDNLADLETELLNDLQASFAAVKESQTPAPPPPPVVRARVVEPEPIYTSPFSGFPQAAAAYSPPAQTAQPPRQDPFAAPPPRAEARPEPQLRDEFRLEPIDDSHFVPIPPPPVIQRPIPERTAERQQEQHFERPIERRAERPVEPLDEYYDEPVERPAPRVARAPTPPEPPKPDVGSFQMRPTNGAAAAPPPPPPRQPHSRWEKPEPQRPQVASMANRFAPPRGAEPTPVDDEEIDPFAEGGLFAETAETAEVEEEFPLDSLGLAPGYGDDDGTPSYPEEDLATLVGRPKKSRRNLFVVASVIAVALIGSVAFAMFKSGGEETGTPPLIAADGAPTKITPEDTTADGDAQSKLIYDRVNGGEAAGDTTLVTPGNEPADTAAGDAAKNPRVIIPGGPGIDAPATATDDALRLDRQADAPPPVDSRQTGDGIGALAEDGADPAVIEPIGPRKVRTVIVKPDGTIVSSEAADQGATPPAAEPIPPLPPVTDDTAAIAGNNEGKALPLTDAPDPAATTAAIKTAPADTAPPVAEAEPAPPPPKPATKVAIAPEPDAPLNPPKNAPTATSAAANGGTLVQISSQKTEDAARATYRDLQARYPNILGKYDVNIQRADVADRGTFYRVRVGPFSANDAQRLCDDLRSAGGDCVLAKR